MRDVGRIVAMEHQRFVQSWKAGRLVVELDRNVLRADDSIVLPKRYRAARIFFSIVWMLSIPAGFAVLYFYAIWAGALIVLTAPRTLFLLAQSVTQKMLTEHAVEDQEFYTMAIEKGLFRIRRSGMWGVEEEK